MKRGRARVHVSVPQVLGRRPRVQSGHPARIGRRAAARTTAPPAWISGRVLHRRCRQTEVAGTSSSTTSSSSSTISSITEELAAVAGHQFRHPPPSGRRRRDSTSNRHRRHRLRRPCLTTGRSRYWVAAAATRPPCRP